MAISRINPVSTTSTGSKIITAAVTGLGTGYIAEIPFPAGAYSISCVSSAITRFYFFNASGQISGGQTVSGSTSTALDSDATGVFINVDSGSDVPVTITQTGSIISAGQTTLDTITTSGTYTPPVGSGAVLCFGGGGGGGAPGGSPNTQFSSGAGGGGGGRWADGYEVFDGSSISVTVGAGGSVGVPGGITSFSNNISASGGNTGSGQSGGTGGGNGGSGGNAGMTSGGAGTPGSNSPYGPIPSGFVTGGNAGNGGNSGNPGNAGGVYAGGGGGGGGYYQASGAGGGGGGGVAASGTIGGAGRIFVIRNS